MKGVFSAVSDRKGFPSERVLNSYGVSPPFLSGTRSYIISYVTDPRVNLAVQVYVVILIIYDIISLFFFSF